MSSCKNRLSDVFFRHRDVFQKGLGFLNNALVHHEGLHGVYRPTSHREHVVMHCMQEAVECGTGRNTIVLKTCFLKRA